MVTEFGTSMMTSYLSKKKKKKTRMLPGTKRLSLLPNAKMDHILPNESTKFHYICKDNSYNSIISILNEKMAVKFFRCQ